MSGWKVESQKHFFLLEGRKTKLIIDPGRLIAVEMCSEESEEGVGLRLIMDGASVYLDARIEDIFIQLAASIDGSGEIMPPQGIPDFQKE